MTLDIYFLGIGGTLMGSLAQLAQQMGHRVSGSDSALYPPMSDLLDAAGITVHVGFDPAQLNPAPDLIVIGNAGLPRGHPGVEYILESGIPYTSGAEWLGRSVLRHRWVLAVSGTHGKTTTATMLTWILEQAGLQPGYLIGGAPLNLPTSARLGEDPFFVVEADEYDTSYFDRRSKFVHYRPRTLIINNLEYDHADIFADLDAIQTQFHHLLRTVPQGGLVIAPSADDAVNEVLTRGCWTPVARVGDDPPRKPLEQDTGQRWHAQTANSDGSRFDVLLDGAVLGTVAWEMLGAHNVKNALAAIAAARHAGVMPEHATEALCSFSGVKRRLEVLHNGPAITLYDDFAHHPTAIRTTLQGLRNKVGNDEIVAVVEPRTHTMSLGTLRHELATCCAAADEVYWFRSENIRWDLTELVNECVVPAHQFDDLERLVDVVTQVDGAAHQTTGAPATASKHDAPRKHRHVVIMSNGSFGGIYAKLTERLRQTDP